MINNTNSGKWDRISAKTLDNQFIIEMMEGLNCSPIEAKAIVEKVHEIYAPIMETAGTMKPGKIQVVVTHISVPPNTPLKQAKKQLVAVTLYDPEQDIPTRKHKNVPSLRQERLCRICEEAFQQGGLFTLEDLSLLFNCGVRTLVDDLAALKEKKILPPLRSNVKDIGRAITHRRLIIRLWLEGKEYSDIALTSHHSVSSVSNYVDKFKRCVALFANDFDVHTVAFLVNISTALAGEFLSIYTEVEPVPHRREELEDFFKKNP